MEEWWGAHAGGAVAGGEGASSLDEGRWWGGEGAAGLGRLVLVGREIHLALRWLFSDL